MSITVIFMMMTASLMSRCDFENSQIAAQDTLLASRVMLSSHSSSLYPPQRSLGGVYWIHPVRPSVRPSVRPWVGVRMITLILFSGFKIFFLHISLGSRSCMGLNISVLPH